jgi:hypothetical protein
MNRQAIALALGIAFVAPIAASAQPMMMHGGYHHRQTSGRIRSVQGSSFTMDNGRTVFLKNGTVINPRGVRLQAGQFVNVRGESAGDHNINAQVVDVSRYRRY